MVKKAQAKSWTGIALDGAQLGMEAWLVIGLRGLRLMSGGPKACDEARLMLSEKIEAGRELGAALSSGAFGKTPKAMLGNTVAFYLAGVRANRRRLTKR